MLIITIIFVVVMLLWGLSVGWGVTNPAASGPYLYAPHALAFIAVLMLGLAIFWK